MMEWTSSGNHNHLFIQMGNLSRSDGSAIISKEDTTVQVAVFGPGDVALHKELPDKATVDILLKSASRSKETKPEDKSRRDFIRRVMDSVIYTEFYPKSLIQIIIQELESDQPLLSFAINGSCAALLDSGLFMKKTIAAVTVSFKEGTSLSSSQKKYQIKTNPTNEDISESIGVMTFVYESTSNNIVGIHTDKVFSPGLTSSQVKDSVIEGRKEAVNIFKLYRDICTESFQ